VGRRDTTLRHIRHTSNIGIGYGQAAGMGGHGSRWVRVAVLLAATVGSAGALGRLSAAHASPPDAYKTTFHTADHDQVTRAGSAP
jgi:hypothetical protein